MSSDEKLDFCLMAEIGEMRRTADQIGREKRLEEDERNRERAEKSRRQKEKIEDSWFSTIIASMRQQCKEGSRQFCIFGDNPDELLGTKEEECSLMALHVQQRLRPYGVRLDFSPNHRLHCFGQFEYVDGMNFTVTY